MFHKYFGLYETFYSKKTSQIKFCLTIKIHLFSFYNYNG